MANSNFIVQNGLEVGTLTIFAGNGDITTSGNISVTGGGSFGGLSSNQIYQGTGSNVNVSSTAVTVGIAGSGNVATFNSSGSTVTGSLLVTGNLTVTGNNFSISSATLNVQDPIINLHSPSDLSPLTSDDGADIGLKMHYYKGGDRAAFLGWQNSTGYLEWYDSGSDTGNVFTGTTQGTIKSGALILANTTATTSTTTGALQVAGGMGIAGNIFLGGSIVPSANVSSNLGDSTHWFNTFYGLATQAKYADLAENYLADKQYNPGTVLQFGGTSEVTIAEADTTRVAGVVSTNPGHLMNGGLTGNNVVPVAFTGRVPCNVIGPVAKGDLMVSAGFGFAKANNNAGVGQVIGKALQDFAVNGKGVIEVVVGRF